MLLIPLLRNHYSSSYVGLFYGPSISKIILKDTTITHCASTGNDAVASISRANSTITVEEGIVIDGNIYIKGNLTNNGTINSNTTLDLSSIQNITSISERDKMKGEFAVFM